MISPFRFILCLLLCPGWLFAVETLDDLAAIAVSKNPERAYYLAEINAAQSSRSAAGLRANPDLAVELGRKTTRDAGLSSEGTAFAVTLSQTFEWPGRLALRKAIANGDIRLAEVGVDRFTAALRAKARLLGYKIFASKERVAENSQVADRFQALHEVLVQRDPAGLTPKLEIRVLEATTLLLRKAVADAKLDGKLAAVELNQLLGRSAGAVLEVAPPQFDLGELPPLESLVARARDNNFDFKTKRLELEQQGLKVALAMHEGKPAITVSPHYAQESAGSTTDRVATIGVSVPLPLWNRNRENVAGAQAREVQAAAMLNASLLDMEKEIATALATYEARREEIKDWDADAIAAFHEAAELADKNYRTGAVPSATYLDLQQKYLDAADALLTARHEAFEARLKIEEITAMPLEAKPRRK